MGASIAIPLALGALGIGSQIYSADRQRNAMNTQYDANLNQANRAYSLQRQDILDAQSNATDTWRENAFPDPNLIQSRIRSNTADINQRSMNAQRQLTDSLASRGIAGGGMYEQGMHQGESERQRQIANMTAQLTQFGMTPSVAPPIMTAYPNLQVPGMGAVPGAGYGAANAIGDMAGTMGGMYAYDWLSNRPGSNQTQQTQQDQSGSGGPYWDDFWP